MREFHPDNLIEGSRYLIRYEKANGSISKFTGIFHHMNIEYGTLWLWFITSREGIEVPYDVKTVIAVRKVESGAC